MMTDEELAAIKERESRATPGPWHADYTDIIAEDGSLLFEGDTGVNTAEFVAHARTDILALLAEVERLRQALEDTERALMREQLSNQDIAELVDTDATRERDTLWSENAALREIVQAVAQTDPTYGSEWRQCHYCHEIDLPDAFQHADDCPVMKARALLASETKDSNGDA